MAWHPATVTQRVLLVAGLLLLAICGLAQLDSILSSRFALEKFEALHSASTPIPESDKTQVEESPQEEVPVPTAVLPELNFRLWDVHRVQAYKESLAIQSPAPLGTLRISKIGLEAPLLDGTDALTLNHAVGRIAGTARPGESGNIGVAGHRDGFFRGLKNIKTGDAIELRTLDGTDTYVVDEIRIVAPDDVSVLQPRQVPSLTLVTCYPFYFIGKAPQRFIVMASLFGETKSGAESSQTSPAISNLHVEKEKQ